MNFGIGSSIPHSQATSHNPYPESNQSEFLVLILYTSIGSSANISRNNPYLDRGLNLGSNPLLHSKPS